MSTLLADVWPKGNRVWLMLVSANRWYQSSIISSRLSSTQIGKLGNQRVVKNKIPSSFAQCLYSKCKYGGNIRQLQSQIYNSKSRIHQKLFVQNRYDAEMFTRMDDIKYNLIMSVFIKLSFCTIMNKPPSCKNNWVNCEYTVRQL